MSPEGSVLKPATPMAALRVVWGRKSVFPWLECESFHHLPDDESRQAVFQIAVGLFPLITCLRLPPLCEF